MILTTSIRPLFEARTYRELLFLAATLPVAAVAFALVVAGWTALAVLAITPLVVPALLGYRGAVGLLARADARLAEALLGVPADPATASGGRGFRGRASAVLADSSFWRQHAYLVVRTIVGFALAVAELSLVVAAAAWITFPVWYRWTDTTLGSWEFDTMSRSLVFVPAALLAIVAAGWLARLAGVLSAWQVRVLLLPRDAAATPPARRLARRRRALAWHAGAALVLAGSQVAIWRFTGAGYFWPEWVALPLGLVLATHAAIELVVHRVPAADRVGRGLAIHACVTALLAVFVTLVWAVTGCGYFWPAWVALGLAIALGLAALGVWTGRRLRGATP